MKKGQGLSITTIVVAAIALLVLVVLVAVFTGRIGGFSKAVADCSQKGGFCADKQYNENGFNYTPEPGAKTCPINAPKYFGTTNCGKDVDCCIPLY